MGINLEQCRKEMAETINRTLREDLEMILRFFGFKAKEN
jgi:hypothetical protein